MAALPFEKEFFNTKIASLRIKSQHCIGILKSRFPCLKTINIWIHKGNPEVKNIVDIVGACSVLHNILLQCNDEIPQEWYDNVAKEINWNINDSDYSTDAEDGNTQGNNEIDNHYNHEETIDFDMRVPNYECIINNYI